MTDPQFDENSHIAHEIRKSGFPLELEIAEVLESEGFEVLPSIFYLDYDDQTYKETDIIAYKHDDVVIENSDKYRYRIRIGLLVECKKREDIAWVFFPTARKQDDIYYHGVGLNAVDSFQVAKISSLISLNSALPRHISLGLQPYSFVTQTTARDLHAAHDMSDFVQASDFHCLSLSEAAMSYDAVKLHRKDSRGNMSGSRFTRL